MTHKYIFKLPDLQEAQLDQVVHPPQQGCSGQSLILVARYGKLPSEFSSLISSISRSHEWSFGDVDWTTADDSVNGRRFKSPNVQDLSWFRHLHSRIDTVCASPHAGQLDQILSEALRWIISRASESAFEPLSADESETTYQTGQQLVLQGLASTSLPSQLQSSSLTSFLFKRHFRFRSDWPASHDFEQFDHSDHWLHDGFGLTQSWYCIPYSLISLIFFWWIQICKNAYMIIKPYAWVHMYS